MIPPLCETKLKLCGIISEEFHSTDLIGVTKYLLTFKTFIEKSLQREIKRTFWVSVLLGV